MNKALGLTIILASLTVGAWADLVTTDLNYLNDDLNALFQSIGSNIAPQLLQATLSSDLVGEAAFKGDFPHGTFTVPALGVDFGNGIATVLNPGARDWEFAVPLPSLVQSALSGSGGQSYYDASRQIFPYPSTAFGLAFGTVQGIEVLADGFYWPQGLTNFIVGLAPPGLSSMNPQFTATSFMVKVRKVLMHDVGPYPAMSLGLGGVYGEVKLGGTINFSEEFSSSPDLNMNIAGTMSVETQVFGTGLEFDISKRLPVITPFANLGLWYRYAEVSMAPDASDPLTLSISSGTNSDSIPLGSSFSAVDQGIDARVGGGFEIRLWAVILHFSAAFDLEEPLLSINSFTLTGISANEFSLSTGFRYAF
jgi:hypothetical protein